MNREDTFQAFEKLFWQLSRQMEYLWKEVYATTFPGSQAYLMFSLQQSGPQKMSELANTLHLTAGAITTASDQLVKQTYIQRKADDKDRRIIRLELTNKGENTLYRLQQEGRKIMKQVFADVSDADLQMMADIFERGTINIEQMK